MKILNLVCSLVFLWAPMCVIAQQALPAPGARLTKSASLPPIWSDDFSSPSKWVISKDPSTTDNWIIGTTPPLHTLDRIKSTTASNGFALFDSDKLCTKRQIAFNRKSSKAGHYES